MFKLSLYLVAFFITILFFLKLSFYKEYTFFSTAHETFSRIDHILGHKSSLGKVKKIEIISNIFSDHNAMRIDINYRKKSVKKYKHMEAKEYSTK